MAARPLAEAPRRGPVPKLLWADLLLLLTSQTMLQAWLTNAISQECILISQINDVVRWVESLSNVLSMMFSPVK